MMASLGVLRALRLQPIQGRELVRAQRTLLTRHDSDLKDNLYCLGLLTHLQSPEVPLKTVDCLRDLRAMYEGATVEDVTDAYAQFNFDDDHVFTCVGTSGREPLALPSPILTAGAAAAAAAGQKQPPAEPDPTAFMAAFKAMLSNQNPAGKQ